MATVDAAKISQVREKFIKKYNGSILDDTYDERDVTWVKSCDPLITNTLKTHKVNGNVDKAVDALNEILLYRAKYNLNDLKESDLHPELRQLNGILFHGKDKDGRPVLHFQVKKQKKGHLIEEGKKYMAFMFNEHYMKHPDQQIAFMFDFTDAGISNMDMDVSRYVVTCTSAYFPGIAGRNFMFKMNAALEAVWMVIKGWLDPDQSKVTVFVSRKDIQKYIDKDQLPAHMIKEEK